MGFIVKNRNLKSSKTERVTDIELLYIPFVSA